jgi:hypothetical protein
MEDSAWINGYTTVLQQIGFIVSNRDDLDSLDELLLLYTDDLYDVVVV